MTSSPLSLTDPAVGSESPAMMCSRVDFPQPDGPISATNSPAALTSCIVTWTRWGNVALEAPSAYAGRMIYDSIVHSPKVLRFLIDLVELDNVALGTDYSFPPADMEPLTLPRPAGLSAAEIKAIADDNPRRVFSRLS